MPFPRLLAGAVAFLLLAGSANAQRRQELTPGGRVRVTAPNFAPGVVTGTVASYSTEGLAVAVEATGDTLLFPLHSVRRLDVFRGAGGGATAARRARSYGFIGLAVGILAGPALAIAGDRDMVSTTALTAAGGLVAGVTLGAVSGSANPTEQWSWNVDPWGYDPDLKPAAAAP